ncbi:enoyl-CoA hydratase/isomerase family protein [Rhizobium oryzicola]|uniref:3-hydroxyisobutyryl-CoA hydrolase n=1 Tax=Rhizobium oryzicola TaxID=1232668 RepID=A0ABT8T4N0_9HYPH|nr:enoyl-CoA hydratase/isomerase family protein [Rhizobium oryzicola]MDO1585379.1 enoyl-CoA hydratase/isomerase family protein [Rhizobium oryzicola]
MPSTSDAISTPAPEQQTIVEVEGSLLRIRLNRPKALNSLTPVMVADINRALDGLEADETLSACLVTGEGERGLCAGGDIRLIYDIGRSDPEGALAFWRDEYRMNARLTHLTKPYIALMDGIVMGGGAGVSVHGSHRIVTERTRFAMPETGIGFFPDVGGSWFLSRQEDELGTYAALTGEILNAGDVLTLGLADHVIASTAIPDVIEALSHLPASAGAAEVTAVIDRFSEAPPPSLLDQERDVIARCFAFETVEEIFAALQREAGEFAERTLATLSKKSPLSLKVTLRLLRLGRNSPSLEACLKREFIGTTQVLRNLDFYEGVRAAVVDKDRNPKWNPATLAEVSQADVDAFFRPSNTTLFPHTTA